MSPGFKSVGFTAEHGKNVAGHGPESDCWDHALIPCKSHYAFLTRKGAREWKGPREVGVE